MAHHISHIHYFDTGEVTYTIDGEERITTIRNLVRMFHLKKEKLGQIAEILDNWNPDEGFNWKVRDELRCIVFGAEYADKLPAMPRNSDEYESERTTK